jgi:SAM-dependent methyltransferase
MTDRRVARELARQSLDRGDPVGWFDELYRKGETDPAVVPWAGDQPNPLLIEWGQRRHAPVAGSRALVVGCGYGYDAEWLARTGYDVTAFDVSPTVIDAARNRHKGTRVHYRTADALDPPAEWTRAFDLVVEAYTLQVLPPAPRASALAHIADLVRDTLVIVARGREERDPAGELPWPLTRAEIERVREHRPDLALRSFEDFFDSETPPVRRFRVEFGVR